MREREREREIEIERERKRERATEKGRESDSAKIISFYLTYIILLGLLCNHA